MYFGSVRFFRHLILTVLLLLIAVPTFFAIRFGVKYAETAGQLAEVQDVVKQYANENVSQDQLVEDLSGLLNSSFYKQIPTFQLQIDNSLSTQLGTLHTGITHDIENQMAGVKQDLTDSLAEKLESLSSENAQLKQKLADLESETFALEDNLMKQADDNVQTLQDQLIALNAQIDILTRQINSFTQGGNG